MALFLPDVNILVHALRADSDDHEPCRDWLVRLAETGGELGLCELVEVALLRIPTLPRLNLVPMPEVLGYWKDDLWGYEGTCRLTAGARHAGILSGFIHDLKLTGNDVNDAWLAALAIEHRAILVSTDSGFSRFHGLAWMNPLG